MHLLWASIKPAGMHIIDIIDLQPVSRRQDDIRHFRHRTPELVDLHQEIHFLQTFDHFLGIGHVDDLLAADADPDPDRFFTLI